MVRQAVVFRMGAKRVIFVILMSVFGTSGCATIERTYAPPTVLAPQSPIPSASQNSFLAPETALSVSTEPAMLDQSIVIEPERIQTATVVEETIALTAPTSATPKTERAETKEKLVPGKPPLRQHRRRRPHSARTIAYSSYWEKISTKRSSNPWNDGVCDFLKKSWRIRRCAISSNTIRRRRDVPSRSCLRAQENICR